MSAFHVVIGPFGGRTSLSRSFRAAGVEHVAFEEAIKDQDPSLGQPAPPGAWKAWHPSHLNYAQRLDNIRLKMDRLPRTTVTSGPFIRKGAVNVLVAPDRLEVARHIDANKGTGPSAAQYVLWEDEVEKAGIRKAVVAITPSAVQAAGFIIPHLSEISSSSLCHKETHEHVGRRSADAPAGGSENVGAA